MAADPYKDSLNEAIKFLEKARDSKKSLTQKIAMVKAAQAIHSAVVVKMGDALLKKLEDLENEEESPIPGNISDIWRM